MEMKNIFSSHINKAGYDPATKELHVLYSKGKTSIYKDVPQDRADEVLNSASIGQAIHQMIRGNYGHSYKDD